MGKLLLIVLGGVLLGALATGLKLRINAAAAEAAYPPEGRMIGGIHYVQRGDGRDVVLIHGASGSTRDFTFQMMDALSDRYRVTAFDRPGFGYSDRVRGAGLSEQANLLANAAQELGIEAPIVLGQSYGGAVALAWALGGHDARALVLVSAVSNPWTTGIGTYYGILSSAPGQAIVAPLISAWVPDHVIASNLEEIFEPNAVPEGYSTHIGPRMSLRLSSFRENALQRQGLLADITAQAPGYAGLSLPVELLHGGADTIVPARIHSIPLAETLPDSNLTLLPGMGHMPHHVDMDTVIQAIDRAALR